MDFKIADTWYKALAVAGVAITVAALAVNNRGVIIFGIGLVLCGIGEFANHPYREIVDGFHNKLSGHPRIASWLGLVLDGIGIGLAIFGLTVVLFF